MDRWNIKCEIFTWYVGCGDWARDATKVKHEAEFRGFTRMRIECVEDGRENHASLCRKSLDEDKQLRVERKVWPDRERPLWGWSQSLCQRKPLPNTYRYSSIKLCNKNNKSFAFILIVTSPRFSFAMRILLALGKNPFFQQVKSQAEANEIQPFEIFLPVSKISCEDLIRY